MNEIFPFLGTESGLYGLAGAFLVWASSYFEHSMLEIPLKRLPLFLGAGWIAGFLVGSFVGGVFYPIAGGAGWPFVARAFQSAGVSLAVAITKHGREAARGAAKALLESLLGDEAPSDEQSRPEEEDAVDAEEEEAQ